MTVSLSKNTPVRLLPVDTEVEVAIYKKGRRENAYKTVGIPVDNGGGDICWKAPR